MVLADAIGARRSLAGIGVELPAVTRMSKDREAKLELRIRNERQQPRNTAPRPGLAARNPDRAEDPGCPAARRKANGRGSPGPALRSGGAITGLMPLT